MKTKVICTLIHCEISVEIDDRKGSVIWDKRDLITEALKKIKITAPKGTSVVLGEPITTKIE